MHELRWLQTTGQLGICTTYPYHQELVRAPARAVGGLQGVQSWRVACGRRRWKIYGEMDWGGKRCVGRAHQELEISSCPCVFCLSFFLKDHTPMTRER